MENSEFEKIEKQVSGEPIIIGSRTLIPLIEYSTYLRKFRVGSNSEFILTGVTIKPISIKIIEGEVEWVLKLQE